MKDQGFKKQALSAMAKGGLIGGGIGALGGAALGYFGDQGDHKHRTGNTLLSALLLGGMGAGLGAQTGVVSSMPPKRMRPLGLEKRPDGPVKLPIRKLVTRSGKLSVVPRGMPGLVQGAVETTSKSSETNISGHVRGVGPGREAPVSQATIVRGTTSLVVAVGEAHGVVRRHIRRGHPLGWATSRPRRMPRPSSGPRP